MPVSLLTMAKDHTYNLPLEAQDKGRRNTIRMNFLLLPKQITTN